MSVTGSALLLANPVQSIHGAAPSHIQIRNYSPWILQATSGGETFYIDPYVAMTLPIASPGSSVPVLPNFLAYPSFPQGYVEAEWLVSNEEPASPDGVIQTIQTVTSGSVKTIGQNSSVPYNTTSIGPFPLQPSTRSIVIIVDTPSLAPGSIVINTVTGNTSSINWGRFISVGSSQAQMAGQSLPAQKFPTAVVCPCYGAVDTSITLTVAVSTQGNVPWSYVILETPDEIMLGTQQEPLASFDPYGVLSVGSATANAGTNSGSIIPNPPTGFANRIKMFYLAAATTVTSTAYVSVIGNLSGGTYIAAWSATGGIIDEIVCDLLVAEGMYIHNLLAVSASANVYWRLEPLPQQ